MSILMTSVYIKNIFQCSIQIYVLGKWKKIKFNIHTDISLLNLVKSNEIWNLISFFRLIWHQAEFRFICDLIYNLFDFCKLEYSKH